MEAFKPAVICVAAFVGFSNFNHFEPLIDFILAMLGLQLVLFKRIILCISFKNIEYRDLL